MKRYFPLLLLPLGLLLLLMPEPAATGLQTGLSLCAGAVLPGLFPFFIWSELWIRSGGAELAAQLAAPVMERLFHLPGAAASAFLLGAVGGYPTGARTVARLYEEQRLTAQQSEQALHFCNNAGPAFLITVAGTALGGVQAGALLYGIHLAAAILTGLLLRPAQQPPAAEAAPKPSSKEPLSRQITLSIASGGQTAIQVCMFVLCFSLITAYGVSLLPNVLPGSFRAVLLSPLELAGGIRLLTQSALSPRLQFSLCAAVAGFGGLCVYWQSLSLLAAAGLSGRGLLPGKLLQGAISLVLAWLFWPILPSASPCMAVIPPHGLFSAAQLALPLLCAAGFAGIAKISSGKPAKNRV